MNYANISTSFYGKSVFIFDFNLGFCVLMCEGMDKVVYAVR